MSPADNKFPATACIDNKTSGDICRANGGGNAPCPWLAIGFQDKVQVSRVVIYNRDHATAQLGKRTKNLEVRVTNEKPTSTQELYTEGQLLGTFLGPGTNGEIIEVEGSAAVGLYVLIQMDNPEWLHFHEVEIFGQVVEQNCQSRERKGKLYKGKAQTTEGGLTCKTWTTYWTSQESSLKGHNYCRALGKSPDGDRGWCYFSENVVSALTNKKWEYCDVPMCGETGRGKHFL